jgi:hypothetical protein
MFLKELSKKSCITITYYQNGLLQTCKGHVYNLDLQLQTLFVKNDQKKSSTIRLADIKEIH